MDVPLALINIGIRQGLEGCKKSSTFCRMTNVVGLFGLYNVWGIFKN